jgi:conjugative transfer region protein (TIGR03750 family)
MAIDADPTGLDQQLADRMNGEPPILRGCASSELLAMAVLGILLWLPACTLAGWAFGAPMIGVGAAGACVVGSVYGGSFVFARLKRGHPDGYYQHHVLVWLQRHRLRHAGFVLPDGPLGLGREHR